MISLNYGIRPMSGYRYSHVNLRGSDSQKQASTTSTLHTSFSLHRGTKQTKHTMIIANIKDEIERLDGVQYTTTHGSKFRVVFQHNADSRAIQVVHKITGCRGQLGATQEHLPCVEFEQDDIKGDTPSFEGQVTFKGDYNE